MTSVAAADLQLSINTSAWTPTFDDEFDTLKLQVNGDAGGWATSYDWDRPWSLSAHTITGESEVYVDPTFAGSGSTPLGLNPFSISNGQLSITPSATPVGDLGALWNHDYVSGLLTTRGSFEQTYGYFEMKAQMPAGQGSFPAFWLLSADGKYNEIDVFEAVNGQNQAWQHLHYTPDGASTQSGFESQTTVPGMTSGAHTYGLLWTSQTITWFIDGTAVASTATPAALNSPMYMLVDYAVGGSWAGAPDGASLTPMTIDYVRAYSLGDAPDSILGQAPSAAPNVSPFGVAVDGSSGADVLSAAGGMNVRGLDGDDTITSTGAANLINGNRGADLIVGGAGQDTLFGGQGDDVIYGGSGQQLINGNMGNDVIHGSSASSMIYGGQGDDTIYGGPAGDTISGDLGNDVMYGGAGADAFMFRPGSGHDWIADFNVGEGDRIVLPTGTAFTITSIDNQVVIELGNGDELGLVGISPGQLPANTSDWLTFA